MAAKKTSPGFDFIVAALKKNPKATYKDIAAAAAKKKLKVFPVMFGRAQAMLGIVKQAARGKGKVAKARDKATSGEVKKCSERPAFGYVGAAAAADAGAAASLALVEDVFGADLDAAVVTKSADKAGAACQAELLKGAQKALETAWKEAGKAKKAAGGKDAKGGGKDAKAKGGKSPPKAAKSPPKKGAKDAKKKHGDAAV